MNILGISAGFHDAAAAVIDRSGDILFAGHSERYSKIKNDANISAGLIEEISKFDIDEIAYYERPWAKQLRRLYSGEGIQWNSLTTEQCVQNQLGAHLTKIKNSNVFDPWHGINGVHIKSFNHHLSHAAGGFQTSPFDRATVVVIDAIGEWDTISIWSAEYDAKGQAKYRQLWGRKYPHSIGLFYSAMTQRVGLKPNEEEYITMGMAAYGSMQEVNYAKARLLREVLADSKEILFSRNLHTGIDQHWHRAFSDVGIAGAAQAVAETLIHNVIKRAKTLGNTSNLVYTGGVALNCVANKRLGEYFDNIWIMPSPGDSGSSLGAAALAFGRRLNWVDAYLGHDIAGPYPINDAVSALLHGDIIGVANGKAEFGPRALGNRSLLADPRGQDIKGKVNEIKRRQKFRPFAPVILEELVHEYFDMPRGWDSSPYMQCVARCKHPDLFPAIVHYDGTSRVQTVGKGSRSGIRELLEKWFVLTDCPMLLNTSLNIRGEPMVNDREDADRFEAEYGIKVYS
jgi:carbamoyltransferase